MHPHPSNAMWLTSFSLNWPEADLVSKFDVLGCACVRVCTHKYINLNLFYVQNVIDLLFCYILRV